MRLLTLLAGALIAASLSAAAQDLAPSLLSRDLARGADYVDSYAAQLAGVVLEERYVQDVRYPTGSMSPPPNPALGPRHRELKSDLLLIRPDRTESWRQFRDVFEVDGRLVRDRNDRLATLFLQPSSSAAAQAAQIAAESARFNIGGIVRDINLPLIALLVIDRGNQPRFTFSHDRATDLGGVPRLPGFTMPAATRVIRYEETRRGTMIKTAEDRDLPMKGRIWIDADSGRVLLTELVFVDPLVTARVHVAYRADASLDLLMPVTMHELYERQSDRMKIEGTATYSNIRRFQVNVDQTIAPIK